MNINAECTCAGSMDPDSVEKCPRHNTRPNYEDIVYRLRKRAEIRRQIPNRKSVTEGKPDRIADILEEAADEIELLRLQK